MTQRNRLWIYVYIAFDPDEMRINFIGQARGVNIVNFILGSFLKIRRSPDFIENNQIKISGLQRRILWI
jgi:hypothetical protein